MSYPSLTQVHIYRPIRIEQFLKEAPDWSAKQRELRETSTEQRSDFVGNPNNLQLVIVTKSAKCPGVTLDAQVVSSRQ